MDLIEIQAEELLWISKRFYEIAIRNRQYADAQIYEEVIQEMEDLINENA